MPRSPSGHGVCLLRDETALTERQRTISREATFEGPGLFSGETAKLTFVPALPDAGITFVREQDGKVATIPASSATC